MFRPALAGFLILLGLAAPAAAQSGSAPSIPQAALIEPAALAAQLKKGETPVLLQVGFRVMYDEAHIPGSLYAGPTGKDEGVALLKQAVASLDREKPLVIFCGCCPWARCPNVANAWKTLTALGFTNLKVLHIADNFGADWAEKGYPTVHG
jgi:thiosulfate/3-mercaptopyruvate sulfurtransferase